MTVGRSRARDRSRPHGHASARALATLDFTPGTLPSGVTYTRAGVLDYMTSPTTVVLNAAANTAPFTDLTGSGTTGLYVGGASTSILRVNQYGVAGNATLNAGVNVTRNNDLGTTGPGGTHVNQISVGASGRGAWWSASAGTATGSATVCFLAKADGANVTGQSSCNIQSEWLANTYTLTSSWQLIKFTTHGTTTASFVPFETTNIWSNREGAASAAAIDADCTAFFILDSQFYRNFHYSADSFSGANCSYATIESGIDAGTVSVELQLLPYCHPGELPADAYVLHKDLNNYVVIRKDSRKVEIWIGGSKVYGSSTPLLWDRFSPLKLRLQFGAKATKVWYSYGSSTTQYALETGSVAGALSLTGAVDLLCNGTTGQLFAELQKITWYSSTFGPVGATDATVRPQVVCMGDSITESLFSAYDTRNWPLRIQAELSSTYSELWDLFNLGVIGSKVADVSARYTAVGKGLYSATRTHNVIVLWAGTNDLAAGTLGATVSSSLRTLANTMKTDGFTVIVRSIIKNGALTAGQETERGNANTAIASWVVTDGFAFDDVASDAAFASTTDTAHYYYNTNDGNNDGTHTNLQASAIVHKTRVVNAMVAAGLV